MNNSTRQVQPEDQASPAIHQKLEKKHQAGITSSPNKEPASSATSYALWSNLKYGAGMLTVILIPPIIPGTTIRGIIIGYMVTVICIYTAALLNMVRRSIKTPVREYNRQYHRSS